MPSTITGTITGEILVITRPGTDGIALCYYYHTHYKSLGVRAVHLPIMELAMIDPQNLNHEFDADKAWVFTSANGVRSAAIATSLRPKIAFAIGGMTAKIMGEFGFPNGHVAGGDSEKLAQYIAQNHDKNIRLVHYGAQEAEESLAKNLRKMGFMCDKITLYYMQEFHTIADDIWQILWENRDQLVFSFYSARTLERTYHLIKQRDAQFPLERASVISEQIAAVARQYGFQSITIDPPISLKIAK